MAQTNSAQREPSMEEILASIRKIIEDSDTAAQPAEPEAAPAAAEAAPEPGSDPDEPRGGVIEVEAFRADLRSRAEAARSEPPAPASLAAVQAAVSAGEPRAERTAAPAADHDGTGPSARPGMTEASAVPDVAGLADPVTLPAAGGESRPSPGADAGEDDMIAELAAPRAAGPWEIERAPAEIVGARPGILSEQAGRQVAAAFGELTDAFAASRRRSFDEMAEEMIRPMLQDWLDNNLPTLVERLVREEIERVARGSGG